MELQDAIRRRRMVRNFDPTPVDPEIVERILENATHAPSAGFSQGWAFVVLTELPDRERFWDAAWPDRDGSSRADVLKAPVVVVPCADRDVYLDRYAEQDKGWSDRSEAHWPVPFWLIDAAFASMLMLLTATDAGLGALFFGYPDPDAVREALGIPERVDPIGAIAIGRRAPDVPSPSLARGRRSMESVVHRGRW